MSPSSSARADDPVIVDPLSNIFTVRVYWMPAFAGMTLKRLRVDQDKRHDGRLAGAIAPGVIGAALDEHVAGFE